MTTKLIIFGDSFSRIFTLLNPKVAMVYPFKGATMKGLTKEGNANRKKIEQILNESKLYNVHIIFNFGQVDDHLSFYYDLIKYDKVTNYEPYITKYVSWISQICKSKNRNLMPIVLGVYPSPLDADYTLASLVKYGIFEQEIVDTNAEKLMKYADDLSRQIRYFEFNYMLKENCRLNAIKYMDLTQDLFNTNLIIKSEYLDISEYNIHLRWEPIIPILIKNLNKLQVQVKSDDIVTDINEIETAYIKYKTDRLQEIGGYS